MKVKRAIGSVHKQTYPDIELVIVQTPSSSLVSESKIRSLVECPVTYIETGPDVGASKARNTGIDQANGKYIAFLDDDDEWLPSKTARQIEILDEQKSASASITGNKKVGTDGQVISEYTLPDPDDLVRYQLCWNIGTFSGLMVDQELVERIGKIDEELDRREDQDFLLRIVRETDLALISEPLYRKHSGDYNQLGDNYENAIEANEKFLQKHHGLVDQYGVMDEVQKAFEFTLGRTALNNRNYRRARSHFWNAIKQDPLDLGLLLHFLAAFGGPMTHKIGKKFRHRNLL